MSPNKRRRPQAGSSYPRTAHKQQWMPSCARSPASDYRQRKRMQYRSSASIRRQPPSWRGTVTEATRARAPAATTRCPIESKSTCPEEKHDPCAYIDCISRLNAPGADEYLLNTCLIIMPSCRWTIAGLLPSK
jgi:hypothetical protein